MADNNKNVTIVTTSKQIDAIDILLRVSINLILTDPFLTEYMSDALLGASELMIAAHKAIKETENSQAGYDEIARKLLASLNDTTEEGKGL